MNVQNSTIDRNKLIQLVHVAKRELDLSDDTYRDALKTHGGADSCSAMSIPQLQKVLKHFRGAGFRTRNGNSRPLADDAQSRKIRALWLALHEAGAVRNPSEAALAGFVKRTTRVAALQWLSTADASKVIENLKSWLARTAPDKGGVAHG